MAKPFNMHLSDDQLDLYLVGHLPFGEQRRLEEHYLVCPRCLARLASTADFIAVLKAARDECPDLFSTHPPQPTRHMDWSPQWKVLTRFAAILIVGVGTSADVEGLQKALAGPR